MEANVQMYNARFMAKGFSQRQGVDYDETFSPVAMIKSIRILLAVAAYLIDTKKCQKFAIFLFSLNPFNNLKYKKNTCF